MKRPISFICTLSVQFLLLNSLSAQNKTATLQAPPPNVNIDGNLNEWGDSLRYYNTDKKINYTLANDKDNLYITIRLNERTEQARLLSAGLTLSINTKGKKKAEQTITFPVAEQGATGKFGPGGIAGKKPDKETITQEDRDELMKARLTKLRNINLTGFKDIEDGIITTNNTYGIKTAIHSDADGNLVYEAAIPLKLFGTYKADKDDWAFNFKINGLTKPTAGGEGGPGEGSGMGGGGRRGGGMRGGQTESNDKDRSELFKSVDFWEKFYLGK